MNFKFQILSQTIAMAIALTTMSACNQQELSQTQLINTANTVSKENPSPTPGPLASLTPSAPPAASATPNLTSNTYPSCVSSDPDHICIGLKVVSYQDSTGVPVLTESDAITLVNGMNASWSQCNIAFQLEVFQIVDPTKQNLNYSPDWRTETYTIREKFEDNSRFLVTAVGPWTASTIAVTTMPGSGVYGTVVDKQYAHNPLTVGHELGHYQGLYHVDDTSNLMSAFIGSNTKTLTASQCATSRQTDFTKWTAMLRKP